MEQEAHGARAGAGDHRAIVTTVLFEGSRVLALVLLQGGKSSDGRLKGGTGALMLCPRARALMLAAHLLSTPRCCFVYEAS